MCSYTFRFAPLIKKLRIVSYSEVVEPKMERGNAADIDELSD